MNVDDAQHNRRPIASRTSAWARGAAARLARSAVTPNQISVASVVFAAVGAAAPLRWPGAAGLLACAVAVQLRLVCNLLDGMVAVEGGKASPLGALYNEFPDRIADTLFIVAIGYAAGQPALGWLGALAAALTAYVRVFGGALGLPQDFRGPMAKPHRMAVITAGCMLAAIEHAWLGSAHALLAASAAVALGSIATCVTRTLAIARRLRPPLRR